MSRSWVPVVMLVLAALGCTQPVDREWDWVALGDPSQAVLKPGDWVALRHKLTEDAMATTSIQQISKTRHIWLANRRDSVRAGAWREGDVLRHRLHSDFIEINRLHPSPSEVSRHVVQHAGWAAYADAIHMTMDTVIQGCWVDWLGQPGALNQRLSWGTEVEVEVGLASLMKQRAAGEWQRQDVWTFPLGASDQLIHPLDSILYLQKGNFEAWCLASLGHREFLSSGDTAVAFRVMWRQAAAP